MLVYIRVTVSGCLHVLMLSRQCFRPAPKGSAFHVTAAPQNKNRPTGEKFNIFCYSSGKLNGLKLEMVDTLFFNPSAYSH